MATEKVRVAPEAAEALREQMEEGVREGFGDFEKYLGTSAAIVADDHVIGLTYGTVTEDSRTA